MPLTLLLLGTCGEMGQIGRVSLVCSYGRRRFSFPSFSFFYFFLFLDSAYLLQLRPVLSALEFNFCRSFWSTIHCCSLDLHMGSLIFWHFSGQFHWYSLPIIFPGFSKYFEQFVFWLNRFFKTELSE